MRTTLESGAWIEHVPIQELKGKHKRDFDRAGKPKVTPGAIGDDGDVSIPALLAGVDITSWMAGKREVLWAIVIESWSYDLPVPVFDRAAGELVNAESLDEIPLDDYEEIEALLAPFAARLARRPDPKNGTTSSSNGSSPARAGGSRRG